MSGLLWEGKRIKDRTQTKHVQVAWLTARVGKQWVVIQADRQVPLNYDRLVWRQMGGYVGRLVIRPPC